MNSVNELYENLSQIEKRHLSQRFRVSSADEFKGWLNAIPAEDISITGLPGKTISKYLSLRKNLTLKNTPKRSIGYNVPENQTRIYKKNKIKKISFDELRFASKGVDHSDRFLKVKDQGNAPSCTGFASASAVEFSVDFKHEISGGFIYNRSKKIDGDDNAGSHLSSNLKAMYKYGICREEDHPYHIPTLLDEPSDKAINRGQNIKLIKHEDLDNPNIVQWIIDMLDLGYVVVVGALVYDSSWFNEYTERTGKIFDPYPGEEYSGGHAFLITGYYKDQNAPGGGNFILLNSWGILWGSDTEFCPAGFGNLSFKYASENILEAYTIHEIEDKWHENSVKSIKIPQPVWYTTAAAYILIFLSVLAGLLYLSSDVISLSAKDAITFVKLFDEYSQLNQDSLLNHNSDFPSDQIDEDLKNLNKPSALSEVNEKNDSSFSKRAALLNEINVLLSDGTSKTTIKVEGIEDDSFDFEKRSQLLKEIQSMLN